MHHKGNISCVAYNKYFKIHTHCVATKKGYGKCSKISNTLKLRTPKIIAENIFQNILNNRTLTFFGKVNF